MSDNAKVEFNKLDYYIIHNGITRNEIKNIRTRHVTTHQRWLGCQEEVCRIEEAAGIESRWTPGSPEYEQALVTLTERKYKQSLDKLECLVVQRLLELTKLGMSGVGEFR